MLRATRGACGGDGGGDRGWRRRAAAAARATTMWNTYQEYANRLENRLAERQRIDRHFELKEGEEAPPLHVQDLSHAWRKFQDSMTEDSLKEFFTLSRKLHAAENPETLASCKRKFGNTGDNKQYTDPVYPQYILSILQKSSEYTPYIQEYPESGYAQYIS
ncbi:hypothetical protein B0H17DRAFT_1131076 [Mycena rosella]|uniref:Uncharacterized protein n=1 Tax=Mycena rosella TaxID=1033263 RepID=A0AAD7DNY7_MYCRO|nr:hypothetical protein B0H17DRAFT_1131076 [Mycena rosella]